MVLGSKGLFLSRALYFFGSTTAFPSGFFATALPLLGSLLVGIASVSLNLLSTGFLAGGTTGFTGLTTGFSTGLTTGLSTGLTGLTGFG